jgi:hypothetical protein
MQHSAASRRLSCLDRFALRRTPPSRSSASESCPEVGWQPSESASESSRRWSKLSVRHFRHHHDLGLTQTCGQEALRACLVHYSLVYRYFSRQQRPDLKGRERLPTRNHQSEQCPAQKHVVRETINLEFFPIARHYSSQYEKLVMCSSMEILSYTQLLHVCTAAKGDESTRQHRQSHEPAATLATTTDAEFRSRKGKLNSINT